MMVSPRPDPRTEEAGTTRAGKNDERVATDIGYADEESDLQEDYSVQYWSGRMPERKGVTIGYADTLSAAWALVRDNRHRSGSMGWLWILDRTTDRALFDLREPRRGLTIKAPRSEFGSAD